jgi:lipopolysaccharide biosynthesis regulator YciM
MIELTPVLLLLAFIAVALAAWALGRRTARARRIRIPRDYYRGLDHLIHDRFDRAAEVFARMAERDGDAAEIQFALGSLFRRRGEVDRAIAIHERLRGHGSASIRDEATYALGLDYQSAGLMDRAESLLEQAATARRFRTRALEQLLRLYEQQADWTKALRVFRELAPVERAARPATPAHYLCELAEQALALEDTARAASLAHEARTHEPGLARARLIAARIAEASDDAIAARQLYLEVLEAAPNLALEVVPRLLALPAEGDAATALDELGERLRAHGMNARQAAWLLVSAVSMRDRDTAAHLAVRLFDGEQGGEAHAFGAALASIGDSGSRYECQECGLHSANWYWRCPKCREWDRAQPSVLRWSAPTFHADAPDSRMGARKLSA